MNISIDKHISLSSLLSLLGFLVDKIEQNVYSEKSLDLLVI